MGIRTFLAILIAVLFLGPASSTLKAQRQVGVRWKVPENNSKAVRQLTFFEDLGITHLNIEQELDQFLWQKIETIGFNIYASIPICFPVASTFANRDSLRRTSIQQYIEAYASHESVTAIGLFAYGHVDDPQFQKAAEPYIRQIRENFKGEVFYGSASFGPAALDSLFDFKMVTVQVGAGYKNSNQPASGNKTGAFLYDPAPEIQGLLTPVKQFLDQTAIAPVPVFFHSSWLLKAIDRHRDFNTSLKLYTSSQDAIFPTPAELTPVSSSHSIIVLTLILIWGVFAVNYSFNPVYRKSLFRYITAHTFFLEDIRQRHIRTSVTGSAIMITHALMAGMCLYSVSSISFSELGLRALYHHYPILAFWNSSIYSIAIWGFIIVFLIEAACFLWILFSNAQINHFDQAINLYTWPLQINLLLVTVIVTLLMAGGSTIALLTLAALFLIIFVSAFILASADSSTLLYLSQKKGLFWALTIGIYVLVFAGLASWLFTNSYLLDVIGLAASL